jgi:malate/lactate dehydrogenase
MQAQKFQPASDTPDCRQKISGYLPKDDGMKKALTGADICIIPAGIPSKIGQPSSTHSGLTILQENLA